MTNVKAQSSNECQNLNVKWMICNLTFEIHLAFGICNLALHFVICHFTLGIWILSFEFYILSLPILSKYPAQHISNFTK